jgi:hypothetical protein
MCSWRRPLVAWLGPLAFMCGSWAGGAGGHGRDGLGPWVSVLRTLGDRQLEVVVLHKCLGLPAERAANVMGISTGAARNHLARGMS